MSAVRTDETEFSFRLELSLDDLYERLSEFQFDREIETADVSRMLGEAGYVCLVDGYESWLEDHT